MYEVRVCLTPVALVCRCFACSGSLLAPLGAILEIYAVLSVQVIPLSYRYVESVKPAGRGIKEGDTGTRDEVPPLV